MQKKHFQADSFVLLLCACLALGACNGSDDNDAQDTETEDSARPDEGDTTQEDVGEEETGDPQPFGSPCSGGGDCIEGVCFEDTCTRLCGTYAMCPEEGYRCSDAGDGALCLATSFEAGPGTTGTNCTFGGGSDCNEGYYCESTGPEDPYAYCTKNCAGDRECPDDFICKADSEGGIANCRPRKYCDTCVINDQCGYAGDLCLTDDHGGRFCSQQCSPDGDTCPIDSTCTDMGEQGWHCKNDYDGGRCIGDGELCSPCEVDAHCTGGGVCLEDRYTKNRFCTVPCSDPSCPAPEEFYCNTENQCRPRKGSCSTPSGGGLICNTCEDLSDCVNGYCMPFPPSGWTNVCGEDCSETMTCPSVWANCYEITSGATVVGHNCLPNENIANCFQFSQCNEYCPDGLSGCPLTFCRL
ncbi:MAG: hypothetical protein ABIJ56_13820 [Pseudomonadota bacterium]